jgi:glycosyltransferase involved in cell wall biosynthesis
MISVLHIIDTGGPGGAETVFLQTATRLSPTRFRSAAVVGGKGWLAERLGASGLQPHVVPARGSFNVRYLATLGRLARQHRAAVIVAHLYGSAVYASLLGGVSSIPVISVLHGQTDVAPSGRLAGVKAAIVRRGSRKVVFVSKRLKEDLAAHLGLPDSQCVVIPNGVDTDAFRPDRERSLRGELGLAEEAILIGSVGNVRRPKAYEVLLGAARALLNRSERFHFIIAGDCSGTRGEELKRLSHELGVDQHVTFLGLRSDVARILNSVDVFALSSTTEGFSIGCIEAMACGVPVVATRSGGPEEILQGGAGILVPTRDPEALARAIEDVSASPELAGSLTAAAMKRVHEEYSLARMLSRYEELLTRVAHERDMGGAAPGQRAP